MFTSLEYFLSIKKETFPLPVCVHLSFLLTPLMKTCTHINLHKFSLKTQMSSPNATPLGGLLWHSVKTVIAPWRGELPAAVKSITAGDKTAVNDGTNWWVIMWNTYLWGFQSLGSPPRSLPIFLSLWISLLVCFQETERVGNWGSAAETDIIPFREEVFPSRYLHPLSVCVCVHVCVFHSPHLSQPHTL